MEELTWRKASRSGGGSSDNCVEVATGQTRVYVRDSKIANSPVLEVSHSDWSAFMAGLRQDPSA